MEFAPKSINRIEQKEKVKNIEGIDFVFSENPELKKIALNSIKSSLENKDEKDEKAKEVYKNYLETIFPQSNIKDIVYHSSSQRFTEFNKQEGGLNQFFFSKDKDTIWKLLASPEGNAIQMACLLNVQNPKIEEFDENDHDGQTYRMRFAEEEGYDAVFIENKINPEDSERVVFNPEQAHILGSQKDQENFKEFVEKKKTN